MALLLCLLCFAARAQEPFLRHYTVNDGLPASRIYKAIPDDDGFIWLCTAHGVSRFNGYEFFNYNLANGFPSHGAFTGAKGTNGRTWFLSFNDRACYYQNGAFHSFPTPYPVSWILPDNSNGDIFFLTTTGHILQYRKDSLLRDITVCEGNKLYHACFAAPGTLILQSGSYGCVLVREGRVARLRKTADSDNNMKFFRLHNGRVLGSNISGIYEYRHDSLELLYRSGPDDLWSNLISDIIEDSGGYWICSPNGLFRCNEPFDLRRATLVTKRSNVVSLVEDREGNLWFPTLREGLYMFRPPGPGSIFFPNDKTRSLVTVSGDGNSNRIFLFYDDGLIRAVRKEKERYRLEDVLDSRVLFLRMGRRPDSGFFMASIASGNYTVCNRRMTLTPEQYSYFNDADHTLYAMNYWAVYRNSGTGDQPVLSALPAQLLARCQARYKNLAVRVFAAQQDTVWFGNEDGLFRYTKNGIDRPFDQPEARAYVSDMCHAPDGTLWVATRGRGVFAVRDHKFIPYSHVPTLNCNSLCSDAGGNIWVAGQEGLYRIDGLGQVRSYNYKSLLPTFEVSSVWKSGHTVFVVTASGLSIFDERSIRDSPPAPAVSIAGVFVNNKSRQGPLQLRYHESHIRIDFAAADFSSVRKPVFHYCLAGRDSVWQSTDQPYADFSYLPPGSYRLYVAAANGDGRRSVPATMTFSIRPPFWNTWWFYACCTIAAIAVVVLVIRYYRILGIRQRMFVENEIKALRLHMNPHFIFNTLNSLQVFIFNNKPLDANHYIAKFSRLIRWVMNYSDRQEITLQEELEFLRNYVDLERLRFEKEFCLELDIDPAIDVETTIIPALVIQPFVENAIRHGLSGKEGACLLEIRLRSSGDFLQVCIRDNGVGREQVRAEQAFSPRETRSTGILYTQERLKLLSGRRIPRGQVSVTDLYEDNRPAGTLVQLLIPIAHETHQRHDRRR